MINQGSPKGVPIHYKSFMTSINAGYKQLKEVELKVPLPRVLIWVPLYHDYGLICRTMALYTGVELFTMDTLTFLQNPIVWPETMQKYKINFTIGPNFSYQLVCRKMKEKNISFDMPFVYRVDIAAEPIHFTTPIKIHEMWGIPKESIAHSYGMAEACIWVSSVLSSFDEETGVAVSGCRDTSRLSGMDFAVGNNLTCKLLPDGETGDIFIQGSGVVKGYRSI
jgi:acyl-CoA synthetase (AMP-forming)/AMP-acid ligase II